MIQPTNKTEVMNALASSTRYLKPKATIKRNDAGATEIDITDRVLSFNISHEYNSRNSRATVILDNYDSLLSPLDKSSSFNFVNSIYNPLIDSSHVVKLYVGVGYGSNQYEYICRFTGVIGDEIEIESSSGTVTLTCRDLSKYLQDTYIYESKSYKGMLVESVINDMIATFLPSSGITVVPQAPTLFMIGRTDNQYIAKDTNLWDAVQLLSDTASHELRFLEDGSFIMRKVRNNFKNDIPNISLNRYTLLSDRLSLTDSEIRNHVMIKVEGFGNIERKNQQSIDRYGRRYFEIHRSVSNVLTTIDQVNGLADTILSDLSYAVPVVSIEIPYNPLLQIGDIITLDDYKLGVNTTDNIFKVTDIQEQFSNERKRTILTLRGYDTVLMQNYASPKEPTNVSVNTIERAVGKTNPIDVWAYKKVFYPALTWTPPSTDVNNVTLPKRFGGYQIERSVTTNGLDDGWGVVAFIPSYITTLDRPIIYFYDYSIDGLAYNSLPVVCKYRIKAVLYTGESSVASAEVSLTLKKDELYDSNNTKIG